MLSKPIRRRNVATVLPGSPDGVIKQSKPFDKVSYPVSIDVWNEAHDNTINILEAHGNIVSTTQSTALHIMIGSWLHEMKFRRDRRAVHSLPCGSGKTSAIRGFCKALNDHAQTQRIVICAEKVEGLCQLKRDMVGDGITKDRISLLHSKRYSPDYVLIDPNNDVASEPSDDPKDLRQFVLLTHAKLQLGFNSFGHDILIYDEALELGSSMVVSIQDLAQAIGSYSYAVKWADRATDNQHALANWFVAVAETLPESEHNDCIQPDALPVNIADARSAIKPIVKGDTRLMTFLDALNIDHGFKVIKDTHQGSHLILIRKTIPDGLTDMAILDASFKCSALMKYAPSLVHSNGTDNFKNHSAVTLHTCEARAGRGHILNELGKGNDPRLFLEVAYLVIQHLKQGRNVLCFTFKDKDKAHPIEAINQQIELQLGHPLEQLERSGELHYLTWGRETALNSFSHCDVVIFAGLHTLSTAVVAGKIYAQHGSLKLDVSHDDLDMVTRSEKVIAIYQAMNRGSCRIMNNGEANPMDAYILSHDHQEIRQPLLELMPGMQTKDHKPKFEQVMKTQKSLAQEAIVRFLSTYQGVQISSTELFKNIGGIPKRIIRDALTSLLENDINFDWKRIKRTLIKLSI